MRTSQRLGIDRQHLNDLISNRRATLSALEMEMVGKCEEAAARAAPRTVRLDDLGTWDRAMWDRYLSAATTLEPDYIPRMLRLHAEIEQLDQFLIFLALPATREPWTKGKNNAVLSFSSMD